MSHDLNELLLDGKRTHGFYSLREPAWHTLGTVVETPASDERVLQIAGLNWEVELCPITCGDKLITTHRAVVRKDTGAILGIVSPSYTPVQNAQLMDWLRSLESVGGVTIETAGCLREGDTVWLQARVADLAFDILGDEFRGYMSITNGHDGLSKWLATPTATRQVCANTTAMIVRQERNNTLSTGYELIHSSKIHSRMELIQKLYAKAAEDARNTKEVLTFLATKPLTAPKLERMFSEPWAELASASGKDEESAKEEGERAKAIRLEREERLRGILASKTCSGPRIRDTLYAAWNAVTEYLEYETPARGRKGLIGAARDRSTLESRFESNLDGVAAQRKDRALGLALELAEIA